MEEKSTMHEKKILNKQTVKELLLPETIIFLRKCISRDVVLPSHDRRNVDFDLLCIQQQRILTKQIRTMKAKFRESKLLNWKLLTEKEKNFVFKRRKEKREQLLEKLNWLIKKQKTRRKLPVTNIKYDDLERKRRRNRKDRERYKIRKQKKDKQSKTDQIENTVINKSTVNINIDDKELLSLGLKFIPTPRWNQKIENKEWMNLVQHRRRLEWDDYHKNKDEENNKKIENNEPINNNIQKSTKLKVPNFSRPQECDISEETKTYISMITNKLRNIKPEVEKLYNKKNNLKKHLRDSLVKLKKLMKKR